MNAVVLSLLIPFAIIAFLYVLVAVGKRVDAFVERRAYERARLARYKTLCKHAGVEVRAGDTIASLERRYQETVMGKPGASWRKGDS